MSMDLIAMFTAIAGVFLVIEILPHMKREVYHQSFWWDTDDGFKVTIVFLYKVKGLPIYFYKQEGLNKNAKNHPDWIEFEENVKILKKMN